MAYGGYSEVFTGHLHRVEGKVDVAIKRLRYHVGEAKVMEAGLSLLFQKITQAHKICPAIRQRSLRMVKVVPSEHLAIVGICHLRRNALSINRFRMDESWNRLDLRAKQSRAAAPRIRGYSGWFLPSYCGDVPKLTKLDTRCCSRFEIFA